MPLRSPMERNIKPCGCGGILGRHGAGLLVTITSLDATPVRTLMFNYPIPWYRSFHVAHLGWRRQGTVARDTGVAWPMVPLILCARTSRSLTPGRCNTTNRPRVERSGELVHFNRQKEEKQINQKTPKKKNEKEMPCQRPASPQDAPRPLEVVDSTQAMARIRGYLCKVHLTLRVR